MVMIKGEKAFSIAMNARSIGSGKEALVLAHGFGGDQSVWDKVIPVLAQSYKVLVFDWCFSGAIKDPNTLFDEAKHCNYDAFADDLIHLLDEFNLESSIFVGHSMAGLIGCIASIKRPHLFTNLILVGSSPRYINSEGYEGGFNIKDIDQIFSSIESNYEEWATGFASIVVDSSDPQSVEMFEKCLKRMKPEIALSVAKTVFLSDERTTLEKVVVPCTILQTTTDIVVPISVTNYMKKTIKGKSSVEIIDAVGHFPQLTAPLKFLEVFKKIMSV